MAPAALLFQSPLVTVERIQHPERPRGGTAANDRSEAYSINFVERGTFALRYRNRSWTISEREIFLTAPGMEYRCREIARAEGAAPGVCLDVRFSDTARDLIGRSVVLLREIVPVVAVNNRRAYLRRRLAAHLEREPDGVAIDLIAGELLHSACEDDGGPPPRPYRPAQLDWYARRVDEARRLLDADYASHYTLDRLARGAGMSPYHFARVFRELAGVPPHRYLLRRRLTAALERLREGAPVTATCFAVGFRNLSHFVHAFRATFQVTPSRCRPAANPNGDRGGLARGAAGVRQRP